MHHPLSLLFYVIHMVISIYIWILIISMFASWIRHIVTNETVLRILYTADRLAEPAYAFVRFCFGKIGVPTSIGMFDFSFLIAYVVLRVLDSIVRSLI